MNQCQRKKLEEILRRDFPLEEYNSRTVAQNIVTWSYKEPEIVAQKQGIRNTKRQSQNL